VGAFAIVVVVLLIITASHRMHHNGALASRGTEHPSDTMQCNITESHRMYQSGASASRGTEHPSNTMQCNITLRCATIDVVFEEVSRFTWTLQWQSVNKFFRKPRKSSYVAAVESEPVSSSPTLLLLFGVVMASAIRMLRETASFASASQRAHSITMQAECS